MNKQELIQTVATSVEMSQKDVKSVLEAIVSTIVAQVVAGEKVDVTGLGRFDSAPTAERTARNPKTGDAIQVPASRRPTFKYSKPVKDAVKATV